MTTLKSIFLCLTIPVVSTLLLTGALYVFLLRHERKRTKQHKLNIKRAILT